MPYIFIILFQIFCVFHVIKTGQERFWISLIAFLPGIGCAVYMLTIILPELFGTRTIRNSINKLRYKMDPEHNLRLLKQRVAISATSENYRLLADELTKLQRFQDACDYYEKALQGVHADDPNIMLKLAIAQFNNNKAALCRQTLDRLIELNPQFRSSEGHLFYARANEACGDIEKALEEYSVLTKYYSGPEASYYYACLLYKTGKLEQARQELVNIENYTLHAPKHYRRNYNFWITKCSEMLKSIQKQ